MAEMNARWNQQEQAPLHINSQSRLHGYRRETCQPIQLEHYIFAIEHVVGKINTLIDAFSNGNNYVFNRGESGFLKYYW